MTRPLELARADTRFGYNKIKFIGIFVGSVVTGVALVLIAVVNASGELAIVQEVNVMQAMAQDRLAKTGLPAGIAGYRATQALAAELSTRDYPVLPIYGTRPDDDHSPVIAAGGLNLSWAQLQQSRISEHGGYVEEGEATYTWTTLASPTGEGQLLVLHRHQPLTAAELLPVYQNRLIVPAIFTVWMTVWISLMLNGLVTRLRAQRDAVERMAWHDPLTGLPNRNLFFRTLDTLVARAHAESRSFWLAVVDLDGFKEVNDTHGHDVGDALLQQVADRFRNTVRQEDMVARTGGDEFILLFRDSAVESCRAVCARIVQELREEYVVLGHRVRISASMGVASFPEDAHEIVELTRKADKSMYMAKRSGGGVVYYSNE